MLYLKFFLWLFFMIQFFSKLGKEGDCFNLRNVLI